MRRAPRGRVMPFIVYVQKRDANVRHAEVLPDENVFVARVWAAQLLLSCKGRSAELWEVDRFAERLEVYEGEGG